jgi:hypothetical protein
MLEVVIPKWIDLLVGNKRPLRDQWPRTDPTQRQRALRKPHHRPFGMQVILDNRAGLALKREGIERGKKRLQRLGQAIISHIEDEIVGHEARPELATAEGQPLQSLSPA